MIEADIFELLFIYKLISLLQIVDAQIDQEGRYKNRKS